MNLWDNDKTAKEQVELVDPSFTILNIIVKYSEFLSISLLLTPHQIGIGQEIMLTSITLHVFEIFMTPIVTFEKTPDR